MENPENTIKTGTETEIANPDDGKETLEVEKKTEEISSSEQLAEIEKEIAAIEAKIAVLSGGAERDEERIQAIRFQIGGFSEGTEEAPSVTAQKEEIAELQKRKEELEARRSEMLLVEGKKEKPMPSLEENDAEGVVSDAELPPSI